MVKTNSYLGYRKLASIAYQISEDEVR